MKINKRIGITFIVVIIIINLVSLSLMNVLSHNSFNSYLASENSYIIEEIYSKMNHEYSLSDPRLYEALDELSDEENVKIQILYNNQVIFESDDTTSNHRGMGMHNRNDSYEEVEDKITVDGESFQVVIGQYKNHMAVDSEERFMNQLNRSHLISFAISLVIGIVATIVVSRQFSRPIMILNKNLRYISKGFYNTHEDIKSNIYEMNQLNISSNQIRKSLNEQDKIREDLITNLSHDLRTPLTVIKTNLEAMSDGVIEINPENIEVATNGLERVISIVGQLDSLTNTSMSSTSKEQINISKELEDVLEIFTGVANKKNIKLKSNIEKGVYLNINIDHYNQILQNLISNAIKYNRSEGSIEVNLMKDKDDVVINVIDTGIGISQNDLPYIFDRFYRCDKSRSVEDSTGVGLSIVKSLVESSGGEISVESIENEGSTFTIRFEIREKINE